MICFEPTDLFSTLGRKSGRGKKTCYLLLFVPASFLARLRISFSSTFAPGRNSAVRTFQVAGLHMVNSSKTCGLEGRPYCWGFFLRYPALHAVLCA